MIKVQTTPNYNNQMSFNGYVDKSVDKVMKNALKNEAEKALKNANRWERPIDMKAVRDLKETKDYIMELLGAFMGKTHPDSVLKASDGALFFQNKTAGVELYLPHFKIENPLNSYIKDRYTIKYMKNFADELTANVAPEEVDKAMYGRYVNKMKRSASDTSLKGRFKHWLRMKNIDKVAKSFGEKDLELRWELNSHRKNSLEKSNLIEKIKKENKSEVKEFLDKA